MSVRLSACLFACTSSALNARPRAWSKPSTLESVSAYCSNRVTVKDKGHNPQRSVSVVRYRFATKTLHSALTPLRPSFTVHVSTPTIHNGTGHPIPDRALRAVSTQYIPPLSVDPSSPLATQLGLTSPVHSSHCHSPPSRALLSNHANRPVQRTLYRQSIQATIHPKIKRLQVWP